MLDYLTLDLPVASWQLIDGCVDNSMAIDVVEGDVATLMHGAVVREAGWRAAAFDPRAASDTGWPPVDAMLPIVLQRTHWTWIVQQLERWEAYQTGDSLSVIIGLLGEALDAEDGA